MATNLELLDTRGKVLFDAHAEHFAKLTSGRQQVISQYTEFGQYPRNEDDTEFGSAEETEAAAQAEYDRYGFEGFLKFSEQYAAKRGKRLKDIYHQSLISAPDATVAGKMAMTQNGQGVRLGVNNQPNISRWNSLNNYDDAFKSAAGEGFPGAAPDQEIIKTAAQNGFTLGQILGPQSGLRDTSGINEIIHGVVSGRMTFWDFVEYVSQPNDSSLGELFSPVFARTPKPTPAKVPLDAVLQQNLLLPDENISSSDVHKNLYSRNRTASSEFPDGLMGGTNIHLIQADAATNEEAKRYGDVFTYEADESFYTSDAQERGFQSNINVKNNTIQSAIKQVPAGADDDGLPAGYVDAVEDQYFPFLFETENRVGEGEFKQYCSFQATLSQLQESYQPNWSSKSFFGRTEKIHTYVETDRTLDLQFVIFANAMRELQNVRERTTWLAQQTYGSYNASSNNVNRIKSGPLVRLTIGDIFAGIPGYIRNLSFNWDHGGPGGKWELTQNLRMPQSVSVSLSFQVIHDFLPHRDYDFYWGLAPGMSESKLIPTKASGRSGGDQGTADEAYVDLLARR